MMNLEKQKENVSVLLKLIKENPELPILPMVATECVCDDSYCYWMAEWSRAEVTKYWCSDERIYQYDDFDDLVETWIDNNYEEHPSLNDEELEVLAERIVNSYDWVDAIIVYINNI
ncbi:MAG: hypothetical protein WC123_08185 [Bacilli bacterium]